MVGHMNGDLVTIIIIIILVTWIDCIHNKRVFSTTKEMDILLAVDNYSRM